MPSSSPELWPRRLRQSLLGPAEGGGQEGRRYHSRHELGRGGMAIVYRAWDSQLNREVALKILPKERNLGIAAERFRREAQVAARLSHPNLVSIFDAAEEDGSMLLVMELVDGQPLSQAMAARTYDRMALVRILEKTSRGVAVAHERGIVHRDLKPANILLTRDGEPKVGDFGLVHLQDPGIALTQTGATLGTPLYMAPEQVEGRTEDISPRTDVYALGVILYEILTGHVPHPGGSSAEIFRRILGDEAGAPRSADPTIHADLETIALKALEKPPGRRYATAAGFADDLARFLAGDPIEARPLTALTRMLRRASRHRRVLVSIAAACIVAASIVWIAGVSAERSRAVRSALQSAGLAEREGRVEAAIQDYRVVLGLDSANAEARTGLERVAAEKKRRESAEAEAQKLLEIARPALDRALQATYRPDMDHAAVSARVDEAQKLVMLAVDKAPDLALGHYLLGKAWDLRGDELKAEACWRKSIALEPASGPARFHLGRILALRAYLKSPSLAHMFDGVPGDAVTLAEEAVSEIQLAMKAGSGFDDALQLEVAGAMLAFVRQDFEGARALCLAGLKKHGRAEGAEAFAWLHSQMVPDPERSQAVELALEIRPKYPMALYCRAMLRSRNRDTARALDDYTEAIRTHPHFLLAYMNRGSLLQDSGDLAGAIADFNEVLRLDPRSRGAFFNRANARRAGGDWDGAIADYNEALRIMPSWDGALYYRAKAVEGKGDLPGALREYDEVLRRFPDRGDVLFTRGRLRAKMGNLDGAIEDFELNLSRDPVDSPVRRSVEAALARARLEKQSKEF